MSAGTNYLAGYLSGYEEGRQSALQTRRGSFAEATINTAVGWGISFIANLTVLPLFGYSVTVADALGIGVVFTLIAFARSYLLRRFFEGRKRRRS